MRSFDPGAGTSTHLADEAGATVTPLHGERVVAGGTDSEEEGRCAVEGTIYVTHEHEHEDRPLGLPEQPLDAAAQPLEPRVHPVHRAV